MTPSALLAAITSLKPSLEAYVERHGDAIDVHSIGFLMHPLRQVHQAASAIVEAEGAAFRALYVKPETVADQAVEDEVRG